QRAHREADRDPYEIKMNRPAQHERGEDAGERLATPREGAEAVETEPRTDGTVPSLAPELADRARRDRHVMERGHLVARGTHHRTEHRRGDLGQRVDEETARGPAHDDRRPRRRDEDRERCAREGYVAEERRDRTGEEPRARRARP